MPEEYEIYSETHDTLPDDLMRFFAEKVCPEVKLTKRGGTYTYRWPDLTIRVRVMSPRKLSSKVSELLRYVGYIYFQGLPAFLRPPIPKRGKRILRRLHRTRLGLVVEFEPGRDEPGRADRLVGGLVHTLRPIVFYGSALLDWKAKKILDMDGTFDRKAEID